MNILKWNVINFFLYLQFGCYVINKIIVTPVNYIINKKWSTFEIFNSNLTHLLSAYEVNYYYLI